MTKYLFSGLNKEIRKFSKIIDGLSIPTIMIQNVYEKIVPFNLWFENKYYQLKIIIQNEQSIFLSPCA